MQTTATPTTLTKELYMELYNYVMRDAGLLDRESGETIGDYGDDMVD